MPHDDRQYFRRRADDEASSASKAASPRAAELHHELAERYARQAEKLDPPSGTE